MQSSGGVFTFAEGRRRPVFMVESGPAAGVISAAYLGKELSHSDLISFDMGGTTAKVGLIRDGTPRITKDYEVGSSAQAGTGAQRGSGYPIRTPRDRSGGDWSRRRIHRLGGLGWNPSGGTPKRRSRARSGLLRAGRQRAHGNRCQPGSGPPAARPLPGRQAYPGRGVGAPGHPGKNAPMPWEWKWWRPPTVSWKSPMRPW